MEKELLQSKLVRSLLIIQNNDQTTEFRRAAYSNACQYVKNLAEIVLLEDEIADLPNKSKKEVENVNRTNVWHEQSLRDTLGIYKGQFSPVEFYKDPVVERPILSVDMGGTMVQAVLPSQ